MGAPPSQDEDAVPTYEESMQQDHKLAPSSAAPLSLTSQLSNARNARINSIITEYVLPNLSAQALSGLFNSTVVLLPSGSSSSSDDDVEEVIGFPSSTTIQLVRLSSPGNTSDFWRQEAVIKDLQSALEARLAASGHNVVQLDEPVPSSSPVPSSLPSPTESRPSSFFSRKPSAPPRALQPTVSESSWSTPAPKDGLRPGQVKVEVRWQEVSLRRETPLGLFETRRGGAVVCKVELGG